MHVIHPDGSAPAKPVSWVAIGSLAAGAFALVTTEFLPVGLLPEIARDLGISDGQAGLMVTIPGFVAAFAAPLTVWVAGETDRRRVLWMLLALLAASNLIVATATGMAQLLAGRVLLGVAVGSFWTIAGSLGPRLRPGPDGIRASALILSGVSLGTVAGVPAGAFIGQLLGWRAAFGASALLAGLAILALLLLLPSVPAGRKAGLAGLPAVLRDGAARVGLSATVLIFVGQFAAYTYVAPFLAERAGIGGAPLTALLLANGVAGFLGNMAGGWLSGRSLAGSVIATSLLLGGSVLALALLGGSPAAAIPLVVLWGFGFGMMPIAMQSWLFSTAPGRIEDMQAVFVSVAQVALGGGALLGGVLADHAGVTGALTAGGLAALGTALVALLARGPKLARA